MKTGLTRKQKVTEFYFNEHDDLAEIYTHNTDLKKRLLAYAKEYSERRAASSQGTNGCRGKTQKERKRSKVKILMLLPTEKQDSRFCNVFDAKSAVIPVPKSNQTEQNWR